VVDAGGEEVDLPVGHAELAGQHPRGVLDAVAEADDLHASRSRYQQLIAIGLA
jgi:hypothetical protein